MPTTEDAHDLAERIGMLVSDGVPADVAELRAASIVGGPAWVRWQAWVREQQDKRDMDAAPPRV